MLKFWSETPLARSREMIADVATWIWVSLWAVIGLRIHDVIAGFAEAGRVLQAGGTNIQGAGATLGHAMADVPLVGPGINDLATSAFGTAGDPFIYVGQELESMFIFIARLLGILVVAVMVVPWLSKYLPWRAERLARVRAAHKAIRRSSSGISDAAMERALASRALNRLSYQELLEHTSDPFGDFATGRYERLARAELNSVGLR
jgi:hypothetical protein